MDKYTINFGKIVGCHGLKGEIKVNSNSDFIEQRLKKGNILYIKNELKKIFEKVQVSSYRMKKNIIILKLKEYNYIDEVEKFKGADIFVEKIDAKHLGKNEFIKQDIIDMEVYTNDEKIGVISEIIETGRNDVWRIKTSEGDILIPYIADVVKKVDLTEKKIDVELMPEYEN